MNAAAAEPVAADGRSQNLVTNPSFEDPVGPGGLPEGWGSFFPQPAGAYNYAIVDGGRTGQRCLKIEGDGTFGAMPANRIEIDPARRYVVRGWIKIRGGERATADVKFHYYAADGRYIDQTRVGFVSPISDDWQFVTVTDRAAAFPQAKYLGLAVATTGKVEAWYDDLELIAFDNDHLPEDFENDYGVTRSAPLALLGRRVGTWETQTTTNPCTWMPLGAQSTGVETIRWSLGGQFIESRSNNLTTGQDSLFLMTFDPREQNYRSWFFDSQGNFTRSDMVGTWDEAGQTFTFMSQDGEIQTTLRLKLIGDDAVEWTGIWKDAAGQTVLDIEGTAHRQK